MNRNDRGSVLLAAIMMAVCFATIGLVKRFMLAAPYQVTASRALDE